MTASSIQITQGSGTRLATNSYTEGGNTVHDEKMILGEPYLATYHVGNQVGISAATAADHIVQLMAGSSLNVYVRRVCMWHRTAATTAAVSTMEILRLTTAGTGGTAITPNPYDTTDAASGATAMSLPTVKGTEGVRLNSSVAHFYQTIPTGYSGYNGLLVYDWDCERLRAKPIRIAAGTTNGICLKTNSGIAAATVIVNVLFQEMSF